LVRTDSLNYPMTWGILDATPRYHIISNDPALVASTSLEAFEQDVAEAEAAAERQEAESETVAA
jgi:hypothetical protein